MKKGYKIVCCKNKKYFSCVTTKKARVQYFFDKFSKPPRWLKEYGFWLNCFSNKKDAIRFFKNAIKSFVNSKPPTLELMRIEYEPKSSSQWYCFTSVLANGKICPANYSYPKGTKFASKIKLIEPIKIENFRKEKRK